MTLLEYINDNTAKGLPKDFVDKNFVRIIRKEVRAAGPLLGEVHVSTASVNGEEGAVLRFEYIDRDNTKMNLYVIFCFVDREVRRVYYCASQSTIAKATDIMYRDVQNSTIKELTHELMMVANRVSDNDRFSFGDVTSLVMLTKSKYGVDVEYKQKDMFVIK